MDMTFLYGTAWKEEDTRRCVADALAVGFRAIDTANQRRHYHEAGVGEAVAAFLAEQPRESLFLQSKFTYRRGQDHRLPYDPDAPLPEQVQQSVESSLGHLHTTYLDALLLHGPATREGLTGDDWAVWQTMESLHAAGVVRQIGISNVRSEQLQALLEGARVAPAFVQNRCYARDGWDASVRSVCREAGVVYQGFSLLTANRKTWGHATTAAIAQAHEATPAQVVFQCAAQMGILPITGTTQRVHMVQDLESRALVLTDEEVEAVIRLE